MSSKTPLFAISTFTPKFSSAGEPRTYTLPPMSSISLLRTIPAPVVVAPNKLCPQPCPILGKASYSTKYAMVAPGLSPLYTALKAVSTPKKFSSMEKPYFFNISFWAFENFYSL